jgi:hypothetical protein
MRCELLLLSLLGSHVTAQLGKKGGFSGKGGSSSACSPLEIIIGMHIEERRPLR